MHLNKKMSILKPCGLSSLSTTSIIMKMIGYSNVFQGRLLSMAICQSPGSEHVFCGPRGRTLSWWLCHFSLKKRCPQCDETRGTQSGTPIHMNLFPLSSHVLLTDSLSRSLRTITQGVGVAVCRAPTQPQFCDLEALQSANKA